MTCLEELERYLGEHDVPYRVTHHRRAFTAQEVAATEHVAGRRFAKVVMAFAGRELVMLVVPAPYRVDEDKLGAIVGAPVRLAHEGEFAARFPDCERGAMPAFGNMYGLRMFAEAGLASDGLIVMQAGDHRVTVEVPYPEWERLVQPTVAHFADDPRRHHQGGTA